MVILLNINDKLSQDHIGRFFTLGISADKVHALIVEFIYHLYLHSIFYGSLKRASSSVGQTCCAEKNV